MSGPHSLAEAPTWGTFSIEETHAALAKACVQPRSALDLWDESVVRKILHNLAADNLMLDILQSDVNYPREVISMLRRSFLMTTLVVRIARERKPAHLQRFAIIYHPEQLDRAK